VHLPATSSIELLVEVSASKIEEQALEAGSCVARSAKLLDVSLEWQAGGIVAMAGQLYMNAAPTSSSLK
jgi:hypothetical protein